MSEADQMQQALDEYHGIVTGHASTHPGRATCRSCSLVRRRFFNVPQR